MTLRPMNIATPAGPKDRLEAALHDLANALAAAQSFGEVALIRARAGTAADPALIDTLLKEIERANGLLHTLRSQTFRAGDVLECKSCGYQFVHRRAAGKPAACRRCKSHAVDRWKPGE